MVKGFTNCISNTINRQHLWFDYGLGLIVYVLENELMN